MTLQSGFFLLLLLLSISFFCVSLLRLIRFLRIGRPDDRSGNYFERIKNVLVVAFGQSKLLREPVAGVMHFFIFWGFVILLFAIVETAGEGLSPGFSLSFLGPVYGPLVFVQDILGLLVALSVLFALFRRYVTRPARLEVSGHSRVDATIILLLIFGIMCAMFGQNAAGTPQEVHPEAV